MRSRSVIIALAAAPLALVLLVCVTVAGVIGSDDDAQATEANTTTGPRAAAGASGIFQAGNIVSDEVFYNVRSMSKTDIATFISQQGAGCSGSWCLKDLRINISAQPADAYCQPVTAASMNAAEAIGVVSTACGINPQVMLTTLQKESQLVGASSPTAGQYQAAWGWHCPDTGPGGSANCAGSHGGFFNQLYGMAKQWSRYRIDPDKYTYRAGQTVDILWNVKETGCGSAPVSIANTATASLYNYTPYQPNPASLAAYPGEGDHCSSYGNRNFHFMFTRYFGPTGGGAPTTAPGAGGSVQGAVLTLPDHPDVDPAVRGMTITAPTPQVARGLAAGFKYLGFPYVWGGGGGGGGPDDGCPRGGGEQNSCQRLLGFDCSGLTAYVLVAGGYLSPGGNSGAQRAGGIAVNYDAGMPGDIVGFPGHVAVYLGEINGTSYIFQASRVGTPVQIVPLTRSDRDIALHRFWSNP